MKSGIEMGPQWNLIKEKTTNNIMFRLAEGLIPNIPDKKSESSAEPADIILR